MKMPEELLRRAPLRLSGAVAILVACLCAAPAFAQGAAQPVVNDGQVQAFFNGIALDQQLAEQYAPPAPQAAPKPQAVAEPLDEALDDAAMDKLEAELDAAIADDAEERTTIAEVPPSPVQIVLLVLASLALLAFAGSVLTLAVRELKKDTQQRKRTYRRRVKHRDKSTPVHAN